MNRPHDRTEESVRRFYDEKGWEKAMEGVSRDAELWEDLRPCASEYVTACRLKLLHFLPKSGERLLDAASGPIQYPEYLSYSEGFQKRVCVDISRSALNQAKARLGERGEYVEASLLELPFPENSFDAALSLHTIYHIEKSAQVKAVRELLRVAKRGCPIVVVYANPRKILARLKGLFSPAYVEDSGAIYYYAHPLDWWKQFEQEAEVSLHCWRSLTASDAKRMIPNNSLGKLFYRGVLAWEKSFPTWAIGWGAYPVIVLKKR